MNKKYFAALLGLTLMFTSLGVSYASGDHKHEHKNMQKSHQKMGSHDMGGKETTLTGNIIGLTCFVKHNATGAKHKQCAKQCAEKGLPLALKTKDNQLYILSGEGHASGADIAKPLMNYLGDEVVVVGKTFEKSGTRMLIIQKIKKA